mgnify:CR=1 FL=1
MATTRAERWASDSFDWMADKWGAYQHPGADMPVAPGKRGPNTDYGVPPGLARPAEFGVPPGIARPTEFGVPPGLAQPGMADKWGAYQHPGAQMSRDEFEKMMKQQAMMEQFKRMIAARRHAAMNP